MKKLTINKILLLMCIFILVQFFIYIQINFATYISLSIQAILLALLYLKLKNIYSANDVDAKIRIVKYYMIWVALEFFRAVFIVNGYWEWKYLITNFLAYALTILIFIGANKSYIKIIFSFWIRYFLWLIPVVFFWVSPSATGVLILPLTFIILFLPLVPLKWKILLLSLIVFFLVFNFNERTSFIKCLISFIFGSIYYLRFFIKTYIFRITRSLLMLLPIVLIILAATNTFNIFNIQEYTTFNYNKEIKLKDGTIVNKNLTSDSRTFLYYEVISSSINHNSWIIGRSPGRGNDSQSFGDEGLRLLGRAERYGNEVGILDIFNWFGIIGLFLYFLVFNIATNLAINKSNNIFAKILGLYVAFIWIWSWVWERPEFRFDYALDLLMLGLCFSNSFREMTNAEVKIWVYGILRKNTLN